MKISVNVSTKKEAKKIVTAVYNSDKSGGTFNKGLGFSGSVLTANTVANDGQLSVEISSNYYQESTLHQIANGNF